MKIIIVDDDNLVLQSLKTILKNENITVLDTCNNGYDALISYKKFHPDIVLMDIRMQEKDGIESTKDIIQYDKDAKILLLTTFNDEEYIKKAMTYGAKGYILKQNFENIKNALEAVYNGNIVFDKDSIHSIINNEDAINFVEEKESEESLSEREKEIIRLISEGLSNKEIADSLFLSLGTVRNYISNILMKLNLRDRTQIVIYYYKRKK